MALPYLEIDLRLTPTDPWREVMIAQMGSIGFECFIDSPRGFKGYIPQNDFQEKDFLKIEIFDIEGLEIDWDSNIIPPENWNHQWEMNFSPIMVGDRCLVRADFHPHEKAEYELVINPKMSFGTGHHETTQMMISSLLEMNCSNKSILEMGTGTGLLAILAEKRGAKKIIAIDNDPWCVENTLENLELNHCQKISAELGSSVTKNNKYDMVLANINRNVLLKQIADYAKVIVPGGDLLMSGFYVEDLGIIQNTCEAEGFRFIHNLDLNNWVAAHFNLS